MLPCNASNNLWILNFMVGLLDKSSGGITINYYTRNLTVLQCTYDLVNTLEIFTGWPPAFFCRYYSLLSGTAVCRCITILLTLSTLLPLCVWNWLHTRDMTTAPTTENISTSIVDTCVLSHCTATITTLCFASRQIHWCAVCCFTESLPSNALSSTLQHCIL
jgi:hypothetical protein